MRTCLDCGVTIISYTSRCLRCSKLHEHKRNAQPQRLKYRDPAYLSLVPSGMCHWQCGRKATTREHLRSGAIVFACLSCNSGRQERNIRA